MVLVVSGKAAPPRKPRRSEEKQAGRRKSKPKKEIGVTSNSFSLYLITDSARQPATFLKNFS